MNELYDLLAQCEDWILAQRKKCCTGKKEYWCSTCLKTEALLQKIHQALQPKEQSK